MSDFPTWESPVYDHDDDKPDHSCPPYGAYTEASRTAKWVIVECETCQGKGNGLKWMCHWCDWEPWKTEPPELWVHNVCDALARVVGSIVEET